MQGIYKITNKKTGDFYIGKSVDVTRRWEQHTNELEKGKHANKKLQAMFNKQGQNVMLDLTFETLEVFKNASEKKLLDREAYWINKHKGKKLMNTLIPEYKNTSQSASIGFVQTVSILFIISILFLTFTS